MHHAPVFYLSENVGMMVIRMLMMQMRWRRRQLQLCVFVNVSQPEWLSLSIYLAVCLSVELVTLQLLLLLLLMLMLEAYDALSVWHVWHETTGWWLSVADLWIRFLSVQDDCLRSDDCVREPYCVADGRVVERTDLDDLRSFTLCCLTDVVALT